MCGTRTPEGKAAVVLFTVLLALMPWAPLSVRAAFADGGESYAPTPDNPASLSQSADDDPAPEAEAIDDEPNPLANSQGTWSLFNLLCVISSVILAATMLVGMLGRKRDEGEPDETTRRRRALRQISVIPAVAAVLMFLLTQDTNLAMVPFDAWSVPFGLIVSADIALRIASIRHKADDDGRPQTGYASTGA